MKILIMGFTKIKYMPYMNFYLENIDATLNDVHLLYWNRDLKIEDTSFLQGVTLHEFYYKQEDDVSKVLKIKSFLKFRKYAKNLIKQENFDLVIVLHSLPGVLIYDILRRKYKDKYIFDYRDSTYEKFLPFKKVIGGLVKGSQVTFVSSDAFRTFLPKKCYEKIFTSHNMLVDSLLYRDQKEKYGVQSDKIRISFWGFIRNEGLNCEMIKKVAKDSRFELHYYGREQQVALNLKNYAMEINAQNVFFHGEYQPQDRYEFVRTTDIIHNIYNDKNMMLAMANKYYDSAIFYIPIMSLQGSFMAETAEKSGIGFSVNPYDDDFTDKIFANYVNINKNEFLINCDKELERVFNEYKLGTTLIKSLTTSSERDNR